MKSLLKKILPPRFFYYLKKKMSSHFDEINLISDFLDFKNGVMFDVGALNGSSFMPFLLKKWDIHAFEPDIENHSKILDYIKKWNLNANLYKNAVSNIEETKMFYKSTSSVGIPSLLKFDKNHIPSHEVKTIMLSKFIEEKKIDKIDFLKIDVEGYDMMVLKGVDFSAIKPLVIMCEFGDKKTELLDYSTKDMAGFLTDQGYYLVYSIWHPIVEYGKIHDWKKLSLDINEVKKEDWGNIIAFNNKKDYEEFKRKHKA